MNIADQTDVGRQQGRNILTPRRLTEQNMSCKETRVCLYNCVCMSMRLGMIDDLDTSNKQDKSG